jgi:chromosome segregation ATPase
MDTVSAIVALLKELGTPAITVVGFAWVIFKLNASKKDMSELRTELKSDVSGLRTELKADISRLEDKVSGLENKVSALDTRLSSSIAGLDTRLSSSIAGLRADVQSIKGNHLPHIEAAIKALAKGTPNEENVKAILDLSREVELKTADNEQ